MLEKRDTVDEFPQSRTLRAFWESVAKGREMLPTPNAIRELANAYFEYEPLTSLSDEEEAILRKTVETFVGGKNTRLIRTFAAAPLVLAKNNDGESCLIDISSDRWPDDVETVSRKEVLSPEDRMKLFTDPVFWNKTDYYHNGEEGMGLTTKGYRPLDEYSLLKVYCRELLPASVIAQMDNLEDRKEYLSFEMVGDLNDQIEDVWHQHFPLAFTCLLDQIRRSCGRNELRVLDVGGGMGEAMRDAKKISPPMETYNLTLDEEPAMFASDHLILCPAERMPRQWEEKMDLVISNMAFPYFDYPDIALLNVIKSLSVGGESYLSFSSCDSKTEHEELARRLRGIYEYLQFLIERNMVSADIWKERKIVDPDWWRTADAHSLLSCGLKLKKLHSLQSVPDEMKKYRNLVEGSLTTDPSS